MRVLIIEDDHDTRRLFTLALELAGHDVATATNGAEGLSAAQVRRPDLILLDLIMPVMNGWEFRIEQRQIPTVADIPVVVVSGFEMTPDLDAAAYLRKPCDLDQLVAAVLQHGTPG